MTIAAIALGGALGSVLRYLMAAAVQQWAGRPFPFGTLAVNVLGCLAIGLAYVWFIERSPPSGDWRLFWMVGVLGGFTTFSAFSLETFALIAQGAAARALLYVLLSVLLCLIATWLGVLAGRQLHLN